MSRSFGETSFTTRPPIERVPSEMSSRPATMRSAVVLPQPDGPTRTRNSPSWMSSVRSKTAWTPLSYTLSTSLKATSAMDPPDVECGAVGGEDALLVAGEEHRHAGQRHLQPDAHEVAVGGAGDRPEAGRVVAVEQIPRVQHRLPRHAGAKAAQGGDCRGAVQARHPHRDAPELPLLLGMRIVAQQPRPERAQEAGVVHHPVPAA